MNKAPHLFIFVKVIIVYSVSGLATFMRCAPLTTCCDVCVPLNYYPLCLYSSTTCCDAYTPPTISCHAMLDYVMSEACHMLFFLIQILLPPIQRLSR